MPSQQITVFLQSGRLTGFIKEWNLIKVQLQKKESKQKNLRNTKCIDKQPDAHYFQGDSIIIYYAILMNKIAFMYTKIAGDTIV